MNVGLNPHWVEKQIPQVLTMSQERLVEIHSSVVMPSVRCTSITSFVVFQMTDEDGESKVFEVALRIQNYKIVQLHVRAIMSCQDKNTRFIHVTNVPQQ